MHYIMKKLNQEKTAATEERRRELEAKGYSCTGVRESGMGGGKEEPDPRHESGKQDSGKTAGKKARADSHPGEGGKDGNGTDDAGKN